MALPFNGDFLLLETSLDEKPEGKAASHLQVTNCFSCISSRSPERGCLVPDGNMHCMAPALIWSDLVGGSVPLAIMLHPGSPPYLHSLGKQPFPFPALPTLLGQPSPLLLSLQRLDPGTGKLLRPVPNTHL